MKNIKSKKSRIITGYQPHDNKRNDYLLLSKQAIEKAGYDITQVNFQSYFKM